MTVAVVATRKRMSKARAERLWAEIRECLIGAEQRLREFILAMGWQSLGYPTLHELCEQELGDVPLGPGTVRVIVYRLLDEGKLDEEIVEALGGRMRDSAVAALRHWKSLGVAPEHASTQVGRHSRSLPSKPSGWNDRVNWSADRRADVEAILAANGYDTPRTQAEWTTRVLDREIAKLQNAKYRR